MAVESDLAFKPQSPAGRSLQLVSPIDATLRAFAEGKLSSRIDVIRVSHQ